MLNPGVDLVVCARCRWQNTNSGEQVVRLVVHPSRHGVIPDIIQTLRPEQFPRLVRLEVSLPHGELQPSDMINDAQWQALWGLVAVPSSVEKLTIDFGPLLFYGHTCGMAHLIASLETPGVALRHITLRGVSHGISMCQLTSTVVALGSQLDRLEFMNLGSLLCNVFENEMATSKLACKQLQFTFNCSQFIRSRLSTNQMVMLWDLFFSDPRLRHIVVITFCMGADQWPLLQDNSPPPAQVPGRHVTIVLQDRTSWDDRIFKLNAFGWLERLAATASEVEVCSSTLSRRFQR